ncbi:MAG: tetratricopeptide repeat protein [Turneriella sp.]|nr:tetratricopeptide repeat protein [Turneriella sp.]
MRALILVFLLFGGWLWSQPAYDRALAFYEQGNFAQCLAELRKLLANSPENADARILAAHCHSARGNYADAVSHLQLAAEKLPDRVDIIQDVMALLFMQGKYREARNWGYRTSNALREEDKEVPAALTLLVARAELGYGKPRNALVLAREAKKSDDPEIKYGSLLTETRALIALGNFAEAEIALNFAEAMRSNDLHLLLRAHLEEVRWAARNFPEPARSAVQAAYEKAMQSQDALVRSAAAKSLERIRTAKAQ